MQKLTLKQLRFCEEYIVDLNATQAAIRAGYSKKTAYSQGQRLLKNVEVQKKIQQLYGKRAKRTQISADRVLTECVRIALSDVGDAFNPNGELKPIHDIPEDVRRAISSFQVIELFSGTTTKVHIGYLKKVKLCSKDKNIEVLFKHLGMFEIDNSQKAPLESRLSGLSDKELIKLKEALKKGKKL